MQVRYIKYNNNYPWHFLLNMLLNDRSKWLSCEHCPKNSFSSLFFHFLSNCISYSLHFVHLYLPRCNQSSSLNFPIYQKNYKWDKDKATDHPHPGIIRVRVRRSIVCNILVAKTRLIWVSAFSVRIAAVARAVSCITLLTRH